MTRLLKICIVSGLLGAMGLMGTTPAQAECIRAEVVVLWSGGTEQTVWPKSNCIYDYGEQQPSGGTIEQTRHEVPTGFPNGARVGLWVPMP